MSDRKQRAYVAGPMRFPVLGSRPSFSVNSNIFGQFMYPVSVQLSLPKALIVTQPLGPPHRASAMLLPSCSISCTITSALKTEGCPKPVRITLQARRMNRCGLFLLSWMQALG